MVRRNIRVILSYDGTNFSGWQIQKKDRTVQGELESALKKLHKEEVKITGAGRTDAGVHAAAQTANFYTSISGMKAEQFVPGLNSILPRDIRVTAAEEVDETFHSRYDALAREYRYYLLPGERPAPWDLRYSWPLRYKPDITVLNRMAGMIVGTHDFSSFTLERDGDKNKKRKIFSSVFLYNRGKLEFRICGISFLWRMVRYLVGTMISIEKSGEGVDLFYEFLNGKKAGKNGIPAPPHGLFLQGVMYHE